MKTSRVRSPAFNRRQYSPSTHVRVVLGRLERRRLESRGLRGAPRAAHTRRGQRAPVEHLIREGFAYTMPCSFVYQCSNAVMRIRDYINPDFLGLCVLPGRPFLVSFFLGYTCLSSGWC